MTSMENFVFAISLLFNVLNTAIPQDDIGDDILQVILWNGSQPALLPCSHPTPTEVTEVQWIFESFTRSGLTRICTIFPNTGCNHTQFLHLTLAKSDGFKTGNYSLHLDPTVEAAGRYTCYIYPKALVRRMDLVVLAVSVNPAGSIPHGSSVYLNSGIGDWSEYNNMVWDIEDSEYEIIWTLNHQPIQPDSHHSFDFRTLNISNFQCADVGLYTCTLKSKDGNTCAYSHFLKTSGHSKRTLAIVLAVLGVALVISAAVLIVCFGKCKTEGQKSAQVLDIEDNYVTLDVATLGIPGNYTRSAAEKCIYANIARS
ncbi:uncharacterized protein LOC127587250 [Pristis pectinata]|uniref:uncharacterized protein LOC127587250 n=1 Tax=Pristis pectinata TaxID=685728 RepID=UPI00223D95B4|nr:uncharacterized protein LOC127587250 [Pristis pectinata]